MRADESGPHRVLIAGVGYRNLRDLSIGPLLADRWRDRAWPPGVQVEDLSFGAVQAVHWFQAAPPFDAAIFVAAVPRGRPPGRVERSEWLLPAVSPEEVQLRVGEAVTGVISLETLLTVLGYFGALPPRVSVVEVEPRDEDWGPELSPLVQAALDDVEALIVHEVQELLT